jgi:hypothetical protein
MGCLIMAQYEYIKRAYGRQYLAGQRVRFLEGVNRLGTVGRENKSQGNYVQVRFDGQKHLSNCHPTSLEILEDRDV